MKIVKVHAVPVVLEEGAEVLVLINCILEVREHMVAIVLIML